MYPLCVRVQQVRISGSKFLGNVAIAGCGGASAIKSSGSVIHRSCTFGNNSARGNRTRPAILGTPQKEGLRATFVKPVANGGILQISYDPVDYETSVTKSVASVSSLQQPSDFVDSFGAKFSCYVNVEDNDLVASLESNSDDGSWIFVDGALVVDNGGGHASVSGSVMSCVCVCRIPSLVFSCHSLSLAFSSSLFPSLLFSSPLLSCLLLSFVLYSLVSSCLVLSPRLLFPSRPLSLLSSPLLSSSLFFPFPLFSPLLSSPLLSSLTLLLSPHPPSSFHPRNKANTKCRYHPLERHSQDRDLLRGEEWWTKPLGQAQRRLSR